MAPSERKEMAMSSIARLRSKNRMAKRRKAGYWRADRDPYQRKHIRTKPFDWDNYIRKEAEFLESALVLALELGCQGLVNAIVNSVEPEVAGEIARRLRARREAFSPVKA